MFFKKIFLPAVIFLFALQAQSQTFNWNGFVTTTNSSTRTFVNGNMTAVVSAVNGGGTCGYSYGSNTQIGGAGVCAGTPNGLFLEMSGASVAWNNQINVAITFATPVCAPATFTIYDINEDVYFDGTDYWSNYCDQVTIGATDQNSVAIAAANITYGGCAVAGNVSTAGSNTLLRGRWTNNNCNCSAATVTINGGGQMIKTINILYNNCQPPTYGKYGISQFQNIVISPIAVSAPPTASITAGVLPCGSNTTTLTAVTNAASPTYSWTGSGGTTINSPTAASTVVTGAGTYTLTVTDGGGACAGIATYTLTVGSGGPTVSIASQSDALCNGGSDGTASVNATGGNPPYTYLWSPSGGSAATANNLAAGTYTCTVSDISGCVQTQVVIISEPTALTATLTATDASCGGSTGTATATANGGTGAFTYSWTPSGQTTQTATGLAVGLYTCVVTDANSCSFTDTITVASSGSIVATVTPDTTVCPGSQVTLTAGGGTDYSWSTTETTSSINVIAETAATYTVIVSSGSAVCADTVSVTVNVFTAPAVPTFTQSGDTIFATPGYSAYQWYFGSDTIPGATNDYYVVTQNGNYNIVVTDSNGCQVGAGILNVVGIEQIENGNWEIGIYPNPSGGNFYIKNVSSDCELEIISPLGQIVYAEKLSGKKEYFIHSNLVFW